MKTYEKFNNRDLDVLYNALDNLQNTIVTLTSGKRYGLDGKWLDKMYKENKELYGLFMKANEFCCDIHQRQKA
jgi:hypothetical protein